MALGSLAANLAARGYSSITASFKRKKLEEKINSGIVEKDDLTWLSSYYYEKRDYFKAESYATKLRELTPEDPVPYNLLFNINFSKKDYRNAISIMEQLFKLGHDSADHFHSLGFCYFLLGENEKADEYRLKAEALDPNLKNYFYKKV